VAEEGSERIMNSTLAVNGTQQFMGRIIPIVYGGFGSDQKCMCDKTIAEIHNQPNYKIRERISDNIKRFKESVDYMDFKKGTRETDTLKTLQNLGYSKQAITQADHIYILSERGYAKLIKIMDTDLAWDIHDRLIDEYFQLREIKQSGDYITRAEFIEFTNSLTSCFTEGFNKMFEMQKLFCDNFNSSMSNLTKYLITQNTPALTPEELYPKPEEVLKVSPQVKEYKNQIYKGENKND